MHTLEVSHVAKSFGSTQAVAEVSFEVERGEIFGLLGPNGAGKTTTIRMLLDIFKPESGAISILGGAMSEAKLEEVRAVARDMNDDGFRVELATGLTITDVIPANTGYISGTATAGGLRGALSARLTADNSAVVELSNASAGALVATAADIVIDVMALPITP